MGKKFIFDNKHQQNFMIEKRTEDVIFLRCINPKYYLNKMQLTISFYRELLKDNQLTIV